ncbi:aerobic C4-dicarboxylate transport protein [Novosphingobium sp. SG751A]|uniref:dicarboxylate/amino acid:cation symporter n=1 Tax=Novosphingobium sp. SG751A TaxID=2587000 RepID=UPI0015547D7D|nr:dicarboxylate/amino acid:cation symporter [Novosphingobium sp. SG751A]NOW44925.1 aerobic C4-dicarboxylate transport protein [Novosphingobium sp. SG751A]
MTLHISQSRGSTQTPLWRSLYVQVLVAIALGILLGWLEPNLGAQMKPLGDGFIKLVKMIIAPVIFLTVVTGITGLGNLGDVGRIAFKTFAYFIVMSTLALIVGLVVANLAQPGAGLNIDPAAVDTSHVAEFTAKAHDQSLTGFLMAMIPTTLVAALANGDVLQVLVVAILFGVALARVGERGAPIVDLLERVTTVIFDLVGILMKAAPIGAFGAMAFTIGKFGLGTLVHLGGLVACFYLTALVFVVVVLGTVAWAAGFSIFKLLAYLKDELLLVLGTSSSESALPALMAKMEGAGCSKPIVGLVVPTGYSFNLDGTNIYMALAALFIAQACNVDLTLGAQISLLLVAVISSKGAAGVTGAGFITLAATLSVVPSIPIAGIALILGIDRFMSECRSLTNFIGNAVATLVIARWEGALDRGMLKHALG